MKLGGRLRRLREGAGISQGEVARRTGLQASYLSRVEHDLLLPGLENLERIARALGMDLAGVFAPERNRSPRGRPAHRRTKPSARARRPRTPTPARHG